MCPQRTYKTEHLTQQNVLRKWFIAWIDLYFCPPYKFFPSEFVTPLTIFMLTPQHLLFYIFVSVFFLSLSSLSVLVWSGGWWSFTYCIQQWLSLSFLSSNPQSSFVQFEKKENKGTHFLFGGDGSKYYGWWLQRKWGQCRHSLEKHKKWRRKIKQVQPMWLCILNKRELEKSS